MALLKRQNNLRPEENTGFGTNSSNSAGRFYNRQGGANVFKKGVGLINRYSWYHTMLGMKRSKFLLLLFIGYITLNLVFASLYYLIGIQHLAGINSGSPLKNFTEVFFFSTQTFTTVGYGRISPTGFLTSALAEVKLTVAMQSEENGKTENKFYNLDVEISKINSLALSWTIVHPINEKSPFYGMTAEDIKNNRIELFVFLKAFDEVFSNTVVGRTSYISEEIIWGARFKLMYHPSHDQSTTILDLARLNDFDTVELSALQAAN